MTRAKDISKIVTDANLSGTLDVTGDLSVDTNTLHVDSTNNRVGIGTTGPATPLDVRTTLPIIRSTYDSTGTYVQMFHNGSNSYFDFSSGSQIWRGAGQAERMRIDTSGNVGIGATSPAATSSTYKNLQVALGATVIGRTDDTPFYLSSNLSYNSGWKYIQNTTATQIALGTNIQFFNAPSGTAGTAATLSERMRIDSSGTVNINTTVQQLVANERLRVNGKSSFTVSGDSAVHINRDTDNGALARFYRGGTLIGSIDSFASTYIIIRSGGDVLYIDDNVQAYTDNTWDMGGPSNRWDDVYATNGTIQTSDRNEKQDIEELSDAEQRVAVVAKGLMRKFRWIDSVAEKGDNARTHFGIIAQDLQDAFTAEGLDASKYAMFTSSTWWELDGKTYETEEEAPESATEKTRLGVRYNQLLAFIISAI